MDSDKKKTKESAFMIIRNRSIGSLLLSMAVVACQAPQKPQDEAFSNQESMAEKTQDDASEGVVGPDEAFFAARYLEQVFQFSHENNSPSIDPGSGFITGPGAVSAFDFKANFTEDRLHLMSHSLLEQGDLDKDGSLSAAEFANATLDPTLYGMDGEKLTHAYDPTLFARIAGADELLQIEECHQFLRDLGPTLKAAWDRIPQQDQRRQLLQAWEKILGRYDTDQNGSLNLQEQRELRKDRALLISRLSGE
jgi:hypothetical protein